MSKADDALLKQARDRFQLGFDADKPQREREKEALRMFALDQWPDAVQQARSAQAATGILPATPARPMLVVDRLREPVNQVVNQERESDLSVELVEAGDFGGLVGQQSPVNAAEIDLREGLIRRIQRETQAASARSWAFLRAVVCGRGYYAINTRYVDGKTFDQEIYYRRIYEQSAVVLDPAHTEPDGSDAGWGFVYEIMPYEQYQTEFPKAKDKDNPNLGCDANSWAQLEQQAPGWFTDEGEKHTRYVRVAEYWYTDYTSRTLCHMPDGSIAWQDELPKDAPKPRATRSVSQKAIKFCKIDGCQILEETEWPSPYIPIIKIVGNEIPPCDQERRVDGMVNKSAIESQRGINYMASKVAEEVGLSQVSPLMATPGQIEGFEAFYQQSATRAFPYIPYNYRDAEGNIAQPPFRPDKNPQIAAVAGALQMFVQSVQTSTGVPDPNMGKADKNSPTWRGTQALLAQGQRGSSNYMDNFKRSAEYDGRIVNSLLYPIMSNRPGRLTQIVNGEGDVETVAIGAPFIMQQDGQGNQMPAPAPPGATSQMQGVREYTLTEHAQFNIAVKVTKGYDTRRDEEAAMFGELLTQNPQLMLWFGDLFFMSQDWPGAKQAAERAKLMLAPPILADIQQKEGGQPPIPPMVQQQMQQMQQQLEQTTQAAQQMSQELQTQQFKVQSDERIALAKIEADKEIANLKLENDRLIAAAKLDASAQAELEKQAAELTRQHLKGQQDIQREVVKAELQPEPEPVQEPME